MIGVRISVYGGTRVRVCAGRSWGSALSCGTVVLGISRCRVFPVICRPTAVSRSVRRYGTPRKESEPQPNGRWGLAALSRLTHLSAVSLSLTLTLRSYTSGRRLLSLISRRVPPDHAPYPHVHHSTTLVTCVLSLFPDRVWFTPHAAIENFVCPLWRIALRVLRSCGACRSSRSYQPYGQLAPR